MHLNEQDTLFVTLLEKAQLTYDELMVDIEQLREKYPKCYSQVEPLIATVVQLTEYIAELNRNRNAVAKFEEMRAEFTQYFEEIFIEAFGIEESIDLANIHQVLEQKIIASFENVQYSYEVFQYEAEMGASQARFQEVSKSFSLFVVGFSQVEIEIYSQLSMRFYSLVTNLFTTTNHLERTTRCMD